MLQKIEFSLSLSSSLFSMLDGKVPLLPKTSKTKTKSRNSEESCGEGG